MKNKSFCILPWMHIATTSTGKYRPCCNIAQGTTITKPDGSHYNVVEDTIEESHYVQGLKALKSQFHAQLCSDTILNSTTTYPNYSTITRQKKEAYGLR